VADRHTREERRLDKFRVTFAQPLAALDLDPVRVAQVYRADEVEALRNFADLIPAGSVEFGNGVRADAPEAEAVERHFVLIGCADGWARIGGNHLLTLFAQRAAVGELIAHRWIKRGIIRRRSRGSEAQQRQRKQ